MTHTALLKVRDLKVKFTDSAEHNNAVDGINFDLMPGEILGIVGESGSGKSVTALSLLRLTDYTSAQVSGSIEYFTEKGYENLLQAAPKNIQKLRGNEIAMIFQEPMTSLNPVLTCGNQVSEVLILHRKMSKKEARKEVIDLFEKVMLPRPQQIFDSYPHQISGGQKQRVMIAMAVACKPKLLIADEPTTALDLTVQKSIISLLQDLQKENGMSVIFISHDLGIVSKICDRTLVMYKGKIVESGNTNTLFSAPSHPYTKGLQACKPPLGIKYKRLPTIADFMEVNTNGDFVEKKTDFGTLYGGTAISKEEIELENKKRTSSTPILRVRNLKTYFYSNSGFFSKNKQTIKAVDDVSFDVYPGETLGLVGESGCGKTTLGRSILRLIEPQSGEIHFDEKDLMKLNASETRKIRCDFQIIFQDPYSSLNPKIKVGEAVLEPLNVFNKYENKKARKEKVIELFETVGLNADYYNRYPHEFSGGQRQRICIARALALQPKFIVCDESVSALDVSVQAQILNLLNELKSNFGLTYIFISHDLSVIHHIADRIAVMKEGKILEMGTPHQIFNHSHNEYTQGLIDAIL